MRKQFNEVLQRQQSIDFEEEWKMIKMMLIIIITFIVTTAPFRYIYLYALILNTYLQIDTPFLQHRISVFCIQLYYLYDCTKKLSIAIS